MPSDPSLAGDTCIFMEAVTGDGGNHTASVWWLSPDIVLTGPISGPDKADPGQNNTVEIKIHRKSEESNCIFPGVEAVNVELWTGNPSIALAPNNAASTKLIQLTGSPVPLPGATSSQIIIWNPPAGVPPSHPESAGHKCLIARVYPDNLTPSPQSFFVPTDQHVAQRNICVVPCNAPGAARRPGPCGLKVNTINPGVEADKVTLRAKADLSPTKFVRRAVMPALEKFPGFKRLAVRPPRDFRFDLRELPDAEVNDQTKIGCLGILFGGKRFYEARVGLKAGQLINVGFEANLDGAEFGDAYIFHLTQTGSHGSPHGGLTLVMVA